MISSNCAVINPIRVRQAAKKEAEQPNSLMGILLAVSIIGLWFLSLLLLLSSNISLVSIGSLASAIAAQMFLYTGLFITAHDAMHGSVYPQNLKVNHGVGRIAVWLYGLFSYRKLLEKHWAHHRFPATELDPDFAIGHSHNPVLWYFNFMQGYWSWTRIGGMACIFITLFLVFHVAIANLFLFWIVPSVLSSIQLFFFGTFLPHREPDAGYTHPHRAQSTALPIFWSFLTCYHFGYHEEHHEHPYVPWWQLPDVYRYNNTISQPKQTLS